MLRYIDTIIIPYLDQQRKTLGLLPDAKALCIFDVFAAHRTDSVLQKLRENNVHCLFIPAGCTSHFQPLDVYFNRIFKSEMKKRFTFLVCEYHRWSADKQGRHPSVLDDFINETTTCRVVD